MALHTISDVGGRVGFERAALAADFLGVFLVAGDAASGAAAVVGVATSDILLKMFSAKRCGNNGEQTVTVGKNFQFRSVSRNTDCVFKQDVCRM